MSRRRFLKNITGMLVATAIPKPLLNVEKITKNNKSFHEMALEERRRKYSEQFEKKLWAGNAEKMRIGSNGSIYINYEK